MMKATDVFFTSVHYDDESLFQWYLELVRPYIVKTKPGLDKPGKKGPKSRYYRRDIWLKSHSTCTAKPHQQADNA